MFICNLLTVLKIKKGRNNPPFFKQNMRMIFYPFSSVWNNPDDAKRSFFAF